MVLGVGVVHPPGEDADDYDGIYYRADEMTQLATDLVGKPLCVEHRDDEPVGTVQRAWVGRHGRLFVLFNTNETTFPGVLAGRLVDHHVCTDLSLGHAVAFDPRRHCVVGKTPVEVSLCTEGARPGTHIYGTVRASRGPRGPNDRPSTASCSYILTASPPPDTRPSPLAVSSHSMSAAATTPDTESTPVPKTTDGVKPAPTPTPTPETASPASTPDANVNQELLDLVTQQESEKTKMLLEKSEMMQAMEALKARVKAAEDKAAELGAGNKRKRGLAFKNAIGDWYNKILNMYNTELKDDEGKIRDMFERMKESESSTPMVNLLACTAAQSAASTVKLEEAYQRSKRLKTERDALQARLTKLQQPALEHVHERFQQRAAPSATPPTTNQWTPVMPRGMKLPEKQRDGMQVRNPDFWNQTMRPGAKDTGSSGGMSWFSEPSLVGKDYQAGRKPVVLPGSA